MGMRGAGRVGVSYPSGCWALGLRRRARRKMSGGERGAPRRPKCPHRQVESALDVFVWSVCDIVYDYCLRV